MMRALAVCVGLFTAGALAWSWSRPSAPVAPPSAIAHDGDQDADTPALDQAVPARVAAPVEARADDASPPPPNSRPAATSDAVETPDAAAPAPPAEQTTAIEVRSAASNLALKSFRWSFVAGERRLSGAIDGGDADLPLPPGVTGELLVEADGMQPERLSEVTATARPAQPLRLEVYLRPTSRGEGVTLLVHDSLRRPVADVRVDAFALNTESPQQAWHLEAPMWSRAATAADGRYTLPPLAPGRYGVQVRAVDSQGKPAPLAAFRSTYDLTGTNGFVEDVVLMPACALRLDLRDINGAAVDPAQRGAIGIRLLIPSDRGVSRRWTSAAPGTAGTTSDVDRMPGPSPVWVAAPVAPGSYTLEITVDGQLAVRQALQLPSGAHTERVLLP